MTARALLATFSAFLLFSGCGKSEQELYTEIKNLESEQKFTELSKRIDDLVSQYPESSYKAELLKQQAGIYASISKDFNKALDIHEKIIAEVDDQNMAAQSRFMRGYIFANELQDYDSARKEYEKFLADFPEHELGTSVQWELEHMGKDLSEIDIFKQPEALDEKKQIDTTKQ